MPSGWRADGHESHHYSVGTDVARRAGGQGFAGATIKSNVAEPLGAAVMTQSIRADAYRGKRIQLSGFLRSANSVGTSGYFWMRVDGAGTTQTSDFMERRPIVGTADWAKYELVLDVPESAIGISFGLYLTGAGQVWLDDVALDIVDADVALTGQGGGVHGRVATPEKPGGLAALTRQQEAAYRLSPLYPVNLDFVQTGRPPPR
jgi:hypothetical protein